VNEDQLSLAIGKKGQNVRLAARLTNWDVDILTPPEFQNTVKRLDTTLKMVEGVTQEMVDKVIALGLIDVRDIEEVGIAPLIDELGMTEQTAQQVVDRCRAEAKLVEAEQEAKRATDAKARQAGAALFSSASAKAAPEANPFAGLGLSDEPAVAANDGDANKLPGALEAATGSPETTTHSSNIFADSDELSPEEQAVQSVEVVPADNKKVDDEPASSQIAEAKEQ
jgi:N utilization substance protein A